MRSKRPHFVTLLLLGFLCRCASLEPDTSEFTSLLPGEVPVTPAGNTAQDSCSAQPSQPASTVPTPAQLGFVGKPALGFSLQSIEFPSHCLSARASTLTASNTYVILPCSTHPAQMFYWAMGTLAQTSDLCMVSEHADPGVFNLVSCPSVPSSGQYTLGSSGGIWLLSQDTNTLYSNGNNSEGGSFTVGPTAATLSPNSSLEMKALTTSEAVAHFVATTRVAGATHIYLQDNNGTRCLTEASGVATLTSCASANTQLWSLKQHSIVSYTGLCLTAASATQGSNVNLQTCTASNLQQAFFLAGGAIGLATPYPNVQPGALALDMNTSVSTTQPSISLMSSTYAKWSIGAQNYH